MRTETLTDQERARLERLLSAIDVFADLDKDMPLQMLRMFLLVCLHEGEGATALAKRAEVADTVASRHLTDMGPLNRYKEEGYKIVDVSVNPLNRRERPATLTIRGRSFAQKLARVVGGS